MRTWFWHKWFAFRGARRVEGVDTTKHGTFTSIGYELNNKIYLVEETFTSAKGPK